LEMVAPVLEAESISAKPEEGVPIPIAAIPEVSSVPIPAQEVKPIYPLPEVAKESAPIATAAPATIQSSAPKLKEVIVKKGDSLDKIARANKVSLDEIVKVNQLPNSFLKIGQVLKIPEASHKTASTPKAETKESSTQFYVVKAGDNPWTIAMKHHMKVEELLKMNHLDKDKAKKLKPGDKLKVK
ncbi:MAG TPA: LysM peptidoglycan-binding domain-containing protein, partial [Chlamydiales bacterium]|nr:LysM peptidoglycan-binding domain-containing protein [Chlamydiales bacterium]